MLHDLLDHGQKLGELQGAVAILVKGDHQLSDFGFQLADDADVREVLRQHVEADRGCTPAGLDRHHLGALDHNVFVAVAMESGTDERSDLGQECLSHNLLVENHHLLEHLLVFLAPRKLGNVAHVQDTEDQQRQADGVEGNVHQKLLDTLLKRSVPVCPLNTMSSVAVASMNEITSGIVVLIWSTTMYFNPEAMQPRPGRETQSSLRNAAYSHKSVRARGHSAT
mmetsp:Transcript_59088/g.139250  ORF Transcript_59088/g.139250 Transcript_59088/m.139250 type:complete len:224 (-) Transcript_59088:7-678(-)